jgi:hypothetical protein
MSRPMHWARLLCAMAIGVAPPTLPSEPPTRVLFVGNSFTFGNDLPRMVVEMGGAHDPPIHLEVDMVARDGMTLEHHWNEGEVARRLTAERWDVVVLQERSSRPLVDPDRMASATRQLAALARKRGVKVVLFETWARAGWPETQARLAAVYQDVAKTAGATVAPVGTTWSRSMALHPATVLHADDGVHASPAGTRLAASVILDTLLRLLPLPRRS